MPSKQRIFWIDFAKAIGIFLVVLGHTELPEFLNRAIYAFHMPLFFFLGGLTFKTPNEEFSKFLKKKIQTYLVPYFSFAFLSYIFWFFVGRKFGADALLNISPYHPLIGIFYGVNYNHYLIMNAVLWFLPCYFCVQLLAHFVLKHSLKVQWLLTLIIAGIGIILANISNDEMLFRLPFSLDSAFFGLSFFVLAFHSKCLFSKEIKCAFIKGVLLFSLGVLISIFSERADMATMIVKEPLSFYLSAILCIYGLCLMVCKIPQNRFIEFLGKNTLPIFTTHLIVGSLLKGVLSFGLKVDLSVFQNAVFANLIFSIVSIALIIPFCIFCRRYLPWLIGQRK